MSGSQKNKTKNVANLLEGQIIIISTSFKNEIFASDKASYVYIAGGGIPG